MTVKELIQRLQEFDEDSEVIIEFNEKLLSLEYLINVDILSYNAKVMIQTEEYQSD